jgi:hypothetical protein
MPEHAAVKRCVTMETLAPTTLATIMEDNAFTLPKPATPTNAQLPLATKLLDLAKSLKLTAMTALHAPKTFATRTKVASTRSTTVLVAQTTLAQQEFVFLELVAPLPRSYVTQVRSIARNQRAFLSLAVSRSLALATNLPHMNQLHKETVP